MALAWPIIDRKRSALTAWRRIGSVSGKCRVAGAEGAGTCEDECASGRKPEYPRARVYRVDLLCGWHRMWTCPSAAACEAGPARGVERGRSDFIVRWRATDTQRSGHL